MWSTRWTAEWRDSKIPIICGSTIHYKFISTELFLGSFRAKNFAPVENDERKWSQIQKTSDKDISDVSSSFFMVEDIVY